jgi:hypothetical protein
MSKETHLSDSCDSSNTAGDDGMRSSTRSFFPELCPIEIIDMVNDGCPITGKILIEFDDNLVGCVSPSSLTQLCKRLVESEKARDKAEKDLQTFKERINEVMEWF